MQDIYLLVGVPAAGKSWVLSRSASNYTCVPHDHHIGRDYPVAVMEVARNADRPVLIEAPFSMSQIMGPLVERGFTVHPVFVFADEDTLRDRYRNRGRDETHIICGHLHRQQTFQARVGQYKAFAGTSEDVLNHLNLLAAERTK